MAANLLDRIDDEFLRCAICMDRFKNPKALPCLHTFCKDCLTNYIEKNRSMRSALRCPSCRAETRLGVDGLPADLFVVGLCEVFNVRDIRYSSNVVCSRCDGQLSGSCSFCTDCRVFLCDSCSTHHPRNELTQHHNVISGSHLENIESILETRSRSPTSCKKHKQEILKLFCEKCEIPLCMLCSVTDHEGHCVTAANELARKSRAKIVHVLRPAENKLNAYESLLEKAKETEISLAKHAQKAKEDIDTQAQNLIDLFAAQVYVHADNLIMQVEERFLLKQQHIANYKSKIENDVEGARNACDYSRKVMRYGNVVEVLTSKNTLTKKLTNVQRAELEPVGTQGMTTFVPTQNLPLVPSKANVGRVYWQLGGEELKANVRRGDRVERSTDWIWECQDGGPGKKGTVTELPDEGGWVRVKWDCGGENKYRLGYGGCYDVELADV
ncbi:E3 ubiquitin-protein ligase TRIM56-like [Glandiceps talaboti]